MLLHKAVTDQAWRCSVCMRTCVYLTPRSGSGDGWLLMVPFCFQCPRQDLSIQLLPHWTLCVFAFPIPNLPSPHFISFLQKSGVLGVWFFSKRAITGLIAACREVKTLQWSEPNERLLQVHMAYVLEWSSCWRRVTSGIEVGVNGEQEPKG